MLKLKHLTSKDKNSVTMYITDSQVTRFLSWKPYIKKVDMEKYFQYAEKCVAVPDEIFCICFNNKVIGTAHILYKDKEKYIQIGYGILPFFWNKGFGLEIGKKIIAHILSSRWAVCSSEVVAFIHKENVAAKKIVKKLKFIQARRSLKKDFYKYTLSISLLNK